MRYVIGISFLIAIILYSFVILGKRTDKNMPKPNKGIVKYMGPLIPMCSNCGDLIDSDEPGSLCSYCDSRGKKD